MNKLFIRFLFLFNILILFSIIYIGTSSSDLNFKEPISELFNSGDNFTSYKLNNQIFISNEQFDDDNITPWQKEYSNYIQISSGILTFDINYDTDNNVNNCPKIILDPAPFYEGNLTIRWRGRDLESNERLEIRYMNTDTTWSNAQILTSYDSSTWQEITFQLTDSVHNTTKSEFKIAIILKASSNSQFFHDYGDIDYILLNTFEFIIQEQNGDNIPQQNSQNIKAFVYPKKDGFYSTQVNLQYKINNSDLSTGYTELSYNSIENGWYNFIIPESAYNFDDICYYRIKSSGSGEGGWISYSDSYQSIYFSAIDNRSPQFGVISYFPTNPEYNNSIQFSVECSEISGDSGIHSLIMYVSNSSGVTTNDYKIYPSESLPKMNGPFHFTIPIQVTKYNKMYYFIQAIDGKGNINSTIESSININDSFPPEIIEYSQNEQDQNYLNEKYLLFDLIEPINIGASGLNLSSIILRYGNESTLTIYYTEISYTSINVNTFNFTIPVSAYTGNSKIYYKLSVKDNAGNFINTSIKYFNIKDLEPPILSIFSAESNYTNNPKFYQDVKISFTTYDVEGGTGFKDIYLLINNGTNPLNSLETSINLTKEWIEGNNYRFIIQSKYLSARDNLFWLATSIDNNGNMRNLTGSFEVFDDVSPKISFNSILPGNQINHNENAKIYFNIYEDIMESGFNLTSNCLSLYIKKNTAPSNEYDGVLIPYNISAPFGGLIEVILDESYYAYGDRVYFWANITDLYGNSNNTFSEYQYFNVIDKVGPYFIINPQNFAPINYNENKTINFIIYEPNDGVGLKSVSIYWTIDNPNISNTSYYLRKSAQLSGFNSNYTFNLYNNEIGGNYNQTIYFILEGEDILGNNRTTPIYSFKIDDFIKPVFIEDPKNQLDVLNNFGKNISLQVYDLDYPYSSGIQSIKLYYRLNNSNVGIGVGEYDGVLDVYEPITRGLKNYKIILSSYLPSNWPNNTRFYYKIYVKDLAGNINISADSRMFYIFEGFSVIVENIKLATENSCDFWYNTNNIEILIKFGRTCNTWYEVDSNFTSSVNFTNVVNISFTNLNEGIHEVKVYFFNEIYFIDIKFGIDLTPPRCINNLKAELVNDIILISWQASPDEDVLTYYEIWRKEGNANFVLLDKVSYNTHQYRDWNTKAGTKYEYKIIVVDRASNKSENNISVVVRTNLPSFLYFIIFIGIGMCTLIVFKVVKSARDTRSLKSLAKLSETQKELLFKYNESDKIKHDKQEVLEKTKAEKEEEQIFEDKSEIEQKVWQEADWRARSLYLEKIKQYYNENMINLIEKAIITEFNGNISESLKYFKIAYRCAEKNRDVDLDILDFLKNKQNTIFLNLYEEKSK